MRQKWPFIPSVDMLLHNYDPCRETSISFQIVYALFQARVVMVTRLDIPWTVRFSVHCPL